MIQKYIILFFIYSILGWIMEVILQIIQYRKIVNRGFLIGPYCPIYGTGVILITLLLKKYADDGILVFILSMLICGTLEYFTSYFMEKIFQARWWDYSNKKMNINGRICLETLIPFGILGYIITEIINPFIFEILNKIPELIILIISIGLSIIFIVDIIITMQIVLNLKKVSKLKNLSGKLKDDTEEISKKVRKIIRDRLRLHRRLMVAFPNIENATRLKEWILEKQEKLKEISKKYSK